MTAYDAYRTWASEELTEPPRVSVVVPAYNEELRILPTVGAIAHHMSSRGEPWELLVADDGSTDATLDLLRGTDLVNLRLLVAERNGGKGSAVRRGVLAARGEYVLFADADQSTPIEQFDRLLAAIRAGHDVAVGSRALSGSAVRGRSLLRRTLSTGMRATVAVATGVQVVDTQCGFKLFTADAARRLFTTQVVDGFSFDLEVLYLAHKLGLRVAEIPVEWIDAPGSTVAATKVSLAFLRDIVRIRARDVRGGYDGSPAVTAGRSVEERPAEHAAPPPAAPPVGTSAPEPDQPNPIGPATPSPAAVPPREAPADREISAHLREGAR